MSARDWIAGARPGAPAALVARAREMLPAGPAGPSAEMAESLVSAGLRLLNSALEAQAAPARAGAVDLLAADACVTWAFEVAADDVASLPTSAQDAMRRIAAVAR
jgi:hypothetical protein